MNTVENILSVYGRSTPTERIEGAHWYRDAHTLALDFSPADAWRGAGVIAALSPQRKWDHNVRLARQAFDTGVATGHTGVMNAQAQRILDGEHAMDVLKGDKVRAFCAAIATNGRSDIATIDRHAYDIAMAQIFTDNTRKIGKRVYRELAADYATAAGIAAVSVNVMQATTWLTWRREKGVK